MSVYRVRAVLSAAIGAMLSAHAASAQETPILPETRSINAGPVTFYPTIAIRDVGTDSNVYNDSTGPRGDFTYSLTPRFFVTAPVGNTRFIGRGLGSLTYYRTYKDQQSISGFFDGRYEVVSPGFRPFATAGFADRRERRGYEIDARLRQRQVMASAGANIDVTAITALTVWAGRTSTKWDRDAEFLNVVLADELDYTASTLAAGARFRVTPLTTIAAIAEFERDRFDRSPLRDADSVRVGPRVDFDSTAAIVGHVAAAYRSLQPLDDGLAGFSGVTATAQLRYQFRDWTEIELDAERDVDFSYDALQPYYLETGGRLEVTQRVIGPVRAIAIGDRRDLHFQMLGETSFTGRHEVTGSLGGGVDIQLSKQLRFELIYERTSRTSSVPESRAYERRRLMAAAIYGQ